MSSRSEEHDVEVVRVPSAQPLSFYSYRFRVECSCGERWYRLAESVAESKAQDHLEEVEDG